MRAENMRIQRLLTLFLVVVMTLASGGAFAQSSKGRIRGRVVDPKSGIPVAAVTVTVNLPSPTATVGAGGWPGGYFVATPSGDGTSTTAGLAE